MLKYALACLIIASSTTMASEPAKLRTLRGATEEGELVRISDKEAVLRGKSGLSTTALHEVLDLTLAPAAPSAADSYTEVALTDGSLLRCSGLAIKGDQAECKLLGGQTIQVQLKALASVLKNAHQPDAQQEWRAILAKRGNLDQLAVKDAAGKVNVLEGTFGKGDAKGTSIEFESTGGVKRQISLGRIHALSFTRKLDAEAPAAVCKISDISHTTWMAVSATFADGRFTIATPAGAHVEYPQEMVSHIDYSQGKLTYLSDLEPVKVVETSNIEGVEHYRRDKSLDNGPLQLATTVDSRTELQTFSKGLTLHASTELVYGIGGQYKEFKTVVGVDASVAADSNVKVTIEGDGRELFAADVRRGDNPRKVACDIKGVQQLRIVVRPAGFFDLGNQVCLGDARVNK
jgi:hypothetical protein